MVLHTFFSAFSITPCYAVERRIKQGDVGEFGRNEHCIDDPEFRYLEIICVE